MNEKNNNKILVLCLLPIYTFIAIFAFFIFGLNSVFAETFYTYDLLTINNSSDQVLCSLNNNTSLLCMQGNGTMYGTASKNYTFAKDRTYNISFTSAMSYRAIHNQIQTTALRQNTVIFWNSTNTSFQYADCIVNNSTEIYQDIDIDELVVVTNYTCSVVMSDTFSRMVYVNQSAADNWIGAYIEMGQLQIDLIPEGNAGIIANDNKNTQNIINNQNQNQQQTNERLDKIDGTLKNDDVSDANSGISNFFNNFTNQDNGGISGIITAPLVAINQMLNQECVDLSAEYKGKSFTIPNGCQFWGSITEVKNWLNIVEGGLLCYLIIRKMYYLIHRLKDPEDDRVEVMSL